MTSTADHPPAVAPVDEPFRVADEAFVIPVYFHQPGAPFGVHLNSMVLRGAEPVLLDTSVAASSEAWWKAVCAVVDPDDVRWIVVTHDDADHIGNLALALERCPNATVVSTWFLNERIAYDLPVPPPRQRWVGAGETLDVGDRTLSFSRPPLYDSPTTRIVHDPVSGVLWGADLFAAPLAAPCVDASALDRDELAGGFAMFQQWNSPWVEMVDRDRFGAAVADLAALDVSAIASTHGPAYLGPAAVAEAMAMLRVVPDAPTMPQPGQPVLDEIIAAITGG